MAGHKAAPVAYTWPTMNGSFIPKEAFNRPEGLISIIENPFVVHFTHRMLAYSLVILVIILTIQAFRSKATPAFKKARNYPWIFVLVQTTLGVLTVITSINIRAYRWNEFEWMAQLHQVVGMLLMLALVRVLFLAGKKIPD